jgi:two-component system sensor histidine kinase TctE
MSLRTRLLLGILLPLAAILALGAWGLYRNALASAQAAFDRQLVSAAHSIADTLRLEGQRLSVSVPYAVLELHAPEPGGVFFHRVTGLEGELLAGDETLPRYRGPVPLAPGYTGLVGLYDDQVRDTPVRVAVVYQPVEGHERTGVVPVQVAEPLSNRERMAQALLWQTLATQLALLAAVALVTVLAVNHALRPLRRLRTELDQRDGQALAPLPEDGAGAELLPVVRALNALMARVRDMLGQQQRFVADAAHQLRTPLAVLQTQLQSGQGGAVEPAVLMREMQGTVQRATALSQQLLSLARVQQLRGGAHGDGARCRLRTGGGIARSGAGTLAADRPPGLGVFAGRARGGWSRGHPPLAGGRADPQPAAQRHPALAARRRAGGAGAGWQRTRLAGAMGLLGPGPGHRARAARTGL